MIGAAVTIKNANLLVTAPTGGATSVRINDRFWGIPEGSRMAVSGRKAGGPLDRAEFGPAGLEQLAWDSSHVL